MNYKKGFSILLTVLLIVSNFTTSVVCSAEELTDSSYTVANNSYNDYMYSNKDKADNNVENIEIFGDVYSFKEIYEKAEFNFNVTTAGFYSFAFDYACSKKVENNPSFTFSIDGEVPFLGATQIEVNRYWNVDEITLDSNGNSIRGEMTVNEEWHTYSLKDASGIVVEPYQFYLMWGSIL